MEKEKLSPQAAKAEFIKSIHKWIGETLEKKNKQEYYDCFKIEGSSIMCELPEDYFNLYSIPSNLKIEMKFVVKKG